MTSSPTLELCPRCDRWSLFVNPRNPKGWRCLQCGWPGPVTAVRWSERGADIYCHAGHLHRFDMTYAEAIAVATAAGLTRRYDGPNTFDPGRVVWWTD